MFGEILFDHLLLTDVVDDGLAMSKEEGSHVEVEEEIDVGIWCEEGVCNTAEFTLD